MVSNTFKSILLSTLIMIAGSAKAQDPNFFIFLCFGQSNMEGQGAIEAQDKVVDSRFRVLQAVDCSTTGREKGIWYDAVPPLTRCWSGLSPADYFGRTLVDNLPEHIRVGVINVSVGGCRIELFDKDIYENYTDTYEESWFQDIISTYEGNPYAYLINLAKSAQKNGVIKGILLHQGETNTGDKHWPVRVKKIYDDMVADLNLNPEETPLLAGELVHEDQDGVCASMNPIINQLPETLPNSYVISSSGCTDKSDNLHFNAAGYRELGRRYGEKMLTLMEYDENVILQSPIESQFVDIFPNPSHGITTFSIQTEKNSQVSIMIYNISGNLVKEVTNQQYLAGHHQIETNLQLAAGTYFCQVKVSDRFIMKKLVIE